MARQARKDAISVTAYKVTADCFKTQDTQGEVLSQRPAEKINLPRVVKFTSR